MTIALHKITISSRPAGKKNEKPPAPPSSPRALSLTSTDTMLCFSSSSIFGWAPMGPDLFDASW